MTPTGSLFFDEMLNAILGKKIEQSQYFRENGQRIPVTLIKAGPCPVVQIKTPKKDGYFAYQLGFGEKKRPLKPILGHSQKGGLKIVPRYLQEVRSESNGSDQRELKPGEVIKVGEVLKVGDKVQVTGTAKGKGFAGVVKRWGFAGGPRTRGQSDRERAPGSIGSTTTPGRVYKGKKMAGRMGGQKVTIKNLEVVEVEGEKNLLVLKGLVPGAKRSLLLIQKQR